MKFLHFENMKWKQTKVSKTRIPKIGNFEITNTMGGMIKIELKSYFKLKNLVSTSFDIITLT